LVREKESKKKKKQVGLGGNEYVLPENQILVSPEGT